MKVSNATSTTPTSPAQRPTGRSSARPPPSPISAEPFALAGPSDPPDPAHHAYRKDLADVALAGRVIASHYAEPVARSLKMAAILRREPEESVAPIAELAKDTAFCLLDDSRGWAWGYAGDERLVGYVPSNALA